VLVLVPEIALADQIVDAFRQRFGRLVAIAHSAQNIAERWASWAGRAEGDARVMIGPRSAVFAPIHDAGLIVVDEDMMPPTNRKKAPLQCAGSSRRAGALQSMSGGARVGDTGGGILCQYAPRTLQTFALIPSRWRARTGEG